MKIFLPLFFLLYGLVSFPAMAALLPEAALKLAQDEEVFPLSPLELTEPDPLLSDPEKPLSDAERQRLEQALEGLNTQATAELNAGNPVKAFELWNRELRLRRFLGPMAEVEALGRVGEVALNEGNFVQVQIVTARLRQIEEAKLEAEEDDDDAPRPVDLDFLQALGRAYEQVGIPERSVTIYQQVLAETRRRQDRLEEEETLSHLGRISLDALDYPAAAQTYENLWVLAKQHKDLTSEAIYLQQLAFVYEQMQQLELPLLPKQEVVLRSIEVRQRLVELIQLQVQTPANQAEIVDRRLEIAADYATLSQIQMDIAAEQEALNQLDLAAQSRIKAHGNYQLAVQFYRETYMFSWSLQQFYRASDALSQLATLYESQNLFLEALQVYLTLLDVSQIARDRYGLMVTYDRMGRIYQATEAYPQALQAYQNALTIARQLGDRQDYFALKIERVRQQLPQ